MKKMENECVGCVGLGLLCLGSSCPNRNVIRFYCDECGEEGKLYHCDGMEICEECLLKKFDIVEGSDD